MTPWTAAHHRLPCPSLSPRACSNSCPLSQWCHPTSSSSVVPFSSCFQSFPESGSFLVSQLFISGGQSIGLQLQHQSVQWIFRVPLGFPLGLTWLVFLQSRNSQESSPAPQFKSINSSVLFSAFFMVQLSHLYMTSGKIIALTRRTFVSKAMPLLFNTLSRFVIAFLPKSKCLLLTNISW